jgi:hypothetical protein
VSEIVVDAGVGSDGANKSAGVDLVNATGSGDEGAS